MTGKTVERWTDIFTTYEESEAAIVAGLLEGSGFPCRVESSRISPLPVSVGRLGEVKVYVRMEDAEKAVMLLEEASAEQGDEP